MSQKARELMALEPPGPLPSSEELQQFFRERGGVVPQSVHDALRHYSPQSLAGALIKGVLECFDDCSRGSDGVLVFIARKMACLYWTLKLNGLQPPDGVNVQTDRFALLMDARAWAGREVVICDDTWVTGAVLTRRYTRLIQYLALLEVGDGATTKQLQEAEERVRGRVNARAILNAERTATSAAAVSWHRDAQKVIARTLAGAGVPYFTDFPVSEEIWMGKKELVGVLQSLDPDFADVTNAAIATSGDYSYTLAVESVLSYAERDGIDVDSELINRLSRFAHAMKLRVFGRRVQGRYVVRFMPKIILAEQSYETLGDIAECFALKMPPSLAQPAGKDITLGHCDDISEREFMKQLFGYVEYLATTLLFETLIPVIQAAFEEVAEDVWRVAADKSEVPTVKEDEKLSRFLLGPILHKSRSGHLDILRVTDLDKKSVSDAGMNSQPVDRILTIPPSPGEKPRCFSQRVDADPDTPTPIALGDDIVEPVEDVLWRHDMDQPGARQTFADLLEDTGYNEWTLSLALDVLNDFGRAVPDQVVRQREDGTRIVKRSYRMGESSNPLDQLERMVTSGRLARLARTVRLVGGRTQPIVGA